MDSTKLEYVKTAEAEILQACLQSCRPAHSSKALTFGDLYKIIFIWL